MKRTILLTIAVVLSFATISHASSVSIDATTGTWDDAGTTRISAGEEVTFTIRYINNSGTNIGGMSNGFKIWTVGNTSFTPISGEILYPDLFTMFDLVFSGQVFSADGMGTDIIGMGGSALTGTGLPDGFNEQVLKIITGGVQEGETLCIDSTFYGSTGSWKWATISVEIFPTWSGQQCFTAMCPSCIGAVFTNCVDTLRTTDCANISYQFEADALLSIPQGIIRFNKLEGPGTIDSVTGEWSYNIPSNKLGTYELLKIETDNSGGCPCYTSECWVVLDYTNNVPADMNGDCSSDISDLVYFVSYMFQEGPAPTPLMAADMNGDSEIDIADLVWLVAYMFQGGPAPIG